MKPRITAREVLDRLRPLGIDINKIDMSKVLEGTSDAPDPWAKMFDNLYRYYGIRKPIEYAEKAREVYEPFKEKKPAVGVGLVVQRTITEEPAKLQAKFDIFEPIKRRREPKFYERRPEPVKVTQQILFPTEAERKEREAVEKRKQQWSLWGG